MADISHGSGTTKAFENPANNQVGTYYYDDYVVIFASLKKDLDEADKLNYKDKFLQSDLFQWESMNSLPQSHLEKLIHSKFAYVFIRKVTSENGLVLPFTYVGEESLQIHERQVVAMERIFLIFRWKICCQSTYSMILD